MEYIVTKTLENGKKSIKSYETMEEAPDFDRVMFTREEWRSIVSQVNELKDVAKQSDDKVDSLNAELEDLRRMNENLMRINKERANADRKIKPKKLNRGYLLLGIREQDCYLGKKKYNAVKVTIQLPCSISLDYNTCIKYINADKWDEYVFLCVENPYYCDKTVPYDSSEYGVLIYDLKFNANYRSGYWELDIFMDRFIDFPGMMKCKE